MYVRIAVSASFVLFLQLIIETYQAGEHIKNKSSESETEAISRGTVPEKVYDIIKRDLQKKKKKEK